MFSSDDDDSPLVRWGSVRNLATRFERASTRTYDSMLGNGFLPGDDFKLRRCGSVSDLTERFNRSSISDNEDKPAKPPVKPRSKKSKKEPKQKIIEKENKKEINSEPGLETAYKQPKKELESENFEELGHKEHTDVPTKIRLADDKGILTCKSDEKVTIRVEHPHVDKIELQRLQDTTSDRVHQLQRNVKENSNLKKITEKDKKGVNREQGLETADKQPNKELKSESVEELSHKEHIDVPTKIRLADDKNTLTAKSDEKVTTTGEHSYVDKTEFQRLPDDNFDLAQKLQKTEKENSSLQEIIRILKEDKTRFEDTRPLSIMRKIGVQHRLQKENNGLRNQVQNLRDEIDKQKNEFQSEMQKVQQEDSNKKTEITELQQEKDDMSNEMQKLRLENKTMKVDFQQLRQEDSNLKNAFLKLQKHNHDMSTEIQKLQREDNNKKSEISKLQQEKDDMSNEMQKLRLENKMMKVDIQQLRQEDNNNKKEISQLRQEKNKTSNEMRQLRQENNNMKTEIQQRRQEYDNLRIAKQKLQKHNRDMSTEMQQLRQENNNFLIEKGSVNISSQILGSGAYGAVYKGEFYGTQVAVKEYHDIIVSSYNKEMLKREINIASQCRHPNLLQFICATKNDKNLLLIVTELMDMTLRKRLEQHGVDELRLQVEEAKLISMDVARGLSYLHSKTPYPIIHRDVSSANVLLSLDKSCTVIKAKISDYGSANFTKACKTKNPGAAIYAAPEASNTQQDPKLDVYSYGCLVCEIHICELPDPKKRSCQIARIRIGETKKIVEQCTAINPQHRPTMQDVIACWEKN